MLNMFATVIAWNIFYSFKIPIPSIIFLITFFILSILCGFYLLYIRINFKYEDGSNTTGVRFEYLKNLLRKRTGNFDLN